MDGLDLDAPARADHRRSSDPTARARPRRSTPSPASCGHRPARSASTATTSPTCRPSAGASWGWAGRSSAWRSARRLTVARTSCSAAKPASPVPRPLRHLFSAPGERQTVERGRRPGARGLWHRAPRGPPGRGASPPGSVDCSSWPGSWPATSGSCSSTSRRRGWTRPRPAASAPSSRRSSPAASIGILLVEHDMAPGDGRSASTSTCSTSASLIFDGTPAAVRASRRRAGGVPRLRASWWSDAATGVGRRRLRRDDGAARRQPHGPGGVGGGAARPERRGEDDAAAGRLGAAAPRPGGSAR